MASEIPIVTALRDDNSDAVYIERHQAADIITELQLAGFAVWNNLLNGDIEAHTQQASEALQMIRYALAKA
jgi:hypothetical protein